MHLKAHLLFYVALILLFNTTFGTDRKKLSNHKRNNHSKNKSSYNRIKRSAYDDERQFGSSRGRRYPGIATKPHNDMDSNEKASNDDNDAPFWGTRGRRDNSSTENVVKNKSPYSEYKLIQKNDPFGYEHEKNAPFWGNRGRKKSDESFDDDELPDVFWANRGRRQEDDPFWGARGRRQEETPFWGNRGRRVSSRLTDVEEDPPFWGNRGRRVEDEPFWGTRGRRQESDEPFWGSRGRRENKGKHKENLKDVLLEAINKVEDNIDSLIRTRKDDYNNVKNTPKTFWANRGRDSKLKFVFNGDRYRFKTSNILKTKPSQSSTLLDDRIFAEQPHYILVERSMRSSAESDPYFITRGKKKLFISGFHLGNRDRRGAIEELVKSVRNDPYYIVRGKKDIQATKIGNFTLLNKDLEKAKELICSSLAMILSRNDGIKIKREVDENDRDRRTILKKLAAQLQMDPYFVSRGKRNDADVKEGSLEDFVNELSAKCT